MSSSRVAQEEEMKREHWSGLQGVQPGKEREGRLGGAAQFLCGSHQSRVGKSGEQRGGSKLLSQQSVNSWRVFSFYFVDSGRNAGKKKD